MSIRVAIALSFVALAAWFALGEALVDIPLPERTLVSAEDIDRAAARPIMSDPPEVEIGGVKQRCNDCHRLFDSGVEQKPKMIQHLDIKLDHGLNNNCHNCHSRTNRDYLILYGEREVGFDRVVDLCAKCHGPTWRDWERGIHGKTVGSWDMDSEEHRRMKCTECHDPHRPAFQPIAPLPGPNTLRMRATQRRDGWSGLEHKVSPLRRWLHEEEQGHE